MLKTQASTESNHQGTNILVVKGTAHTRLKEIHAKAMVIAFASFDVGHLKKNLLEKTKKKKKKKRKKRWRRKRRRRRRRETNKSKV